MGLKNFTISFSDLSQDSYLRNDVKYHDFLYFSGWNLFDSKSKNLITLKDVLLDDYILFNYQENEEYKGIPTGQDYIDEDGEIIDSQLVNAENHPGRLKYKVSKDNILISSLRLAKSPALYFENKDLSEYVFSNGFYIFKVKEGWSKKFILYILRSKRLKNILDDHIYRGIGISAYKKEDFFKIKIPAIPKHKQDKIIVELRPIEAKIQKLKGSVKDPQLVINKILSREFNFDIEEVNNIEKIRYFSISNDFGFRNSNLRSSVRWSKIESIQKFLYKNNPYIEKLGKYIISTKNGWSPNCRESDSDYSVFGLNSISKDGYIKYKDLKYSNQEKNNISDYYVKENDLFVSRGNTVDLVALASVVKKLPEDVYFVFPDLFIRVEPDPEHINKEYLAHLFNSIIGRFYFKYASKGKNQTMVKISSYELNNFYLPIPPLGLQNKIVTEIRKELNKQEGIRKKIRMERSKIDEIIEQTVRPS